MSKPASSVVDLEWCRRLPKIELHAHLSGSISLPCLQYLWTRRRETDPEFDLPAPETVLESGQDISTFFSHFSGYVYHLNSTPDSLQYAVRRTLSEFADDGVVYVELRTTPRAIDGCTAEETVRLILREFVSWNDNQSHTQAGGMQARLILSIDRSKHTPTDAENIVRLAISLRSEGLPVVGIDISGNVESPLPDYTSAFHLANSASPRLESSLHFAEVPNSSSPAELERLLSYKPSRLGHVIHVPVSLRERIADAGIAVELLLTCNVLSRMVDSYEAHHVKWWVDKALELDSGEKVGISIGTDDVGVFGSTLAEEYVLMARYCGLGREEVLRIAQRGLGGMFDALQRERVAVLLRGFGAGNQSR